MTSLSDVIFYNYLNLNSENNYLSKIKHLFWVCAKITYNKSNEASKLFVSQTKEPWIAIVCANCVFIRNLNRRQWEIRNSNDYNRTIAWIARVECPRAGCELVRGLYYSDYILPPCVIRKSLDKNLKVLIFSKFSHLFCWVFKLDVTL